MLNRTLPIVIAGGGPAGSSLAIRLASRGLEVVLIERERFPRPKLCGQFISPECFSHFSELGVMARMLAAGGDRVTETRFFAPSGRSITVPSRWFPGGQFALSLSRAQMDAILLDRAREIGVRVIEEATITDIDKDGETIRGVAVRDHDGNREDIPAAVLVDATGRRRALSRLAMRGTGAGPTTHPRFVGFRADLKGIEIKAGTCEIYGFRGGYAGLCYVEGGMGNICFLARSSVVRDQMTADRIVENVLMNNKRAQIALGRATRVSEWLAVAIDGFGFQPRTPLKNLVGVGDASAFIDPFTGSGILMAMEGAKELCLSLVEENSTADELERRYSDRLRRSFGHRFGISRILRAAALAPGLSGPAVAALSANATLRQAVARLTRTPFPFGNDIP